MTKQERINLSVLTNGKKYPAGYKNFGVVLKDVPAEVYTFPMKKLSGGTSGTPAELYNFAREYAPMFVSKCENYVLAADKAMGVDIKITFYPSLAYTNGQGFAFRVKVTALNSTSYTPVDLFGEKAITNRDKKLTKGNYECIAYFEAYDKENQLQGKSGVEINIRVKN